MSEELIELSDGTEVAGAIEASQSFALYRKDMNRFIALVDSISEKGGLSLDNITQMILFLVVAQAKDTGQIARMHSKSLDAKMNLLLKCWTLAEEQARRNENEELRERIQELERLLENVQQSINT